MKKVSELTKLEKLVLLGLLIEGVTGVLGGAVILTEKHPYIALTILAIGAAATKLVRFLEKKESTQKENEINP